jgi:hypothetical protein
MSRRAPLLASALVVLACLVAAGLPFVTRQAQAQVRYPRAFAATDDAAVQPGGKGANEDRDHRLQIVANLRARPPVTPTVLLLGGSSARESTIDDANWAAQIKQFGGPTMTTYNLGCKHDTYELDRKVIELLPQDMPAIVYIGINLGRFCNPPTDPTLTLPDPDFPPTYYHQHVYSIHKYVQSASLKRYYVHYWTTLRWPEFRAHYRYDIGVVDSLVRICKERGLHPVLLDLPRDLPIIGHAFDSPVATYKAGCRTVAAKYDVPFVAFVSAAHFVDGDFFDIFHLVEPGRVKYQKLLSEKTVALAAKYDLHDPEPTPTPTPSPSPSAAPTSSGTPAQAATAP